MLHQNPRLHVLNNRAKAQSSTKLHNPRHQLPTVQALHTLWQQHKRRFLWRPKDLWRLWRLQRCVDLRPIALHRVRVRVPSGLINACDDCTDICCVGPHAAVSLRLEDIATLIDLGRADLIGQHKPQFTAGQHEDNPALQRHVSSAFWHVFPTLVQHRFDVCKALSKAGKCTLYPYWPLICARFPYTLDPQTQELFYARRCGFAHKVAADDPRVYAMARNAVDCYNARITDAVLLTFCAPELTRLGLTTHLNLHGHACFLEALARIPAQPKNSTAQHTSKPKQTRTNNV